MRIILPARGGGLLSCTRMRFSLPVRSPMARSSSSYRGACMSPRLYTTRPQPANTVPRRTASTIPTCSASASATLSTPSGAATFVRAKDDDGQYGAYEIGQLLAPHITTWTGCDLAKFITYLVLGGPAPDACTDRFGNCDTQSTKILRHLTLEDGESRTWWKVDENTEYVDKQWTWRTYTNAMLDTARLATLLHGMQPTNAITPPELASCGVLFLSTRHIWKTHAAGAGWDSSSFKRHAADIGGVLGGVRNSLNGTSTWSADDVATVLNATLAMMTPADIEHFPDYLLPFLCNLGIRLSTTECVHALEGLDAAGLTPTAIAKLSQAITPIGGDDLACKPTPVSLTHANATSHRYVVMILTHVDDVEHV